jgi:hypothetical protein
MNTTTKPALPEMPAAKGLLFHEGDEYESGWLSSEGAYGPDEMAEYAQSAIDAATAELRAETAEQREAKDGAYLERNQCVALIARMALSMGLTAGLARTAIEGWSEDWHGCVYIDLPTGQASWHYHDSQAELFAGLPPYTGAWDGHSTPEKYERLARAFVAAEARAVPAGCPDRNAVMQMAEQAGVAPNTISHFEPAFLRFATLLADALAAAPSPAERPEQGGQVYLVATGETHEGQETYTRHDSKPPLCDSECLYSSPQDGQRKGLTETITVLRAALETARNGLLWYQDQYPLATDGSDDEAMAEIDAALAHGIGLPPQPAAEGQGDGR